MKKILVLFALLLSVSLSYSQDRTVIPKLGESLLCADRDTAKSILRNHRFGNISMNNSIGDKSKEFIGATSDWCWMATIEFKKTATKSHSVSLGTVSYSSSNEVETVWRKNGYSITKTTNEGNITKKYLQKGTNNGTVEVEVKISSGFGSGVQANTTLKINPNKEVKVNVDSGILTPVK